MIAPPGTAKGLRLLVRLGLVVYFLGSLNGCFSVPTLFKRPVAAAPSPTTLRQKFESLTASPAAPGVAGNPAAGKESPAAVDTPATRFIPYSRTQLPGPEFGTLPSMNLLASLAPVIASPSAPAVLWDIHRWFWVAVILCAVAAVIAFFTTHFLAGIKFSLAAAVGAALNYLFGVVIGSFVLACLAWGGICIVVTWYILNGRHHFEPSAEVAAVNVRLRDLENLIQAKAAPKSAA